MKTVCLLLMIISPLLSVKAETFFCNRLNLQWNPITANLYSERGVPLNGILSVTREARTQKRYGNISLVCDDNTRIANSSISNIFIPGHVELSVNFSLQQLNPTQPSDCHLQYCFTRSVGDNCTIKRCNFTLPMEIPIPEWINPNDTHSEPVYFQWIPINDDSGNLIITYYNETKQENYQYEVLCTDGFAVRNYTSAFARAPSVDGIAGYRIFNVSLSVARWKRIIPPQYYCHLRVCIDRQQQSDTCRETHNFSVTIPDIHVSKRIIKRPNVLYHYWQKPSSAVELQVRGDQMNCDNIKFYWMMHSNIRGKLIVQYNIPSSIILLSGQFSVSCGAQVRQAVIPEVSLQRNFGIITLTFTLEYFNNSTYCSLDFCLYDSTRERKCSHQEAYCNPIILFKDRMQDELMDEDYITLREAEQCHMNTWLWVVHSSEKGEAHFILEEDILDAAKYSGKISLSCANLAVISTNPVSAQHVLWDAGIASFIVQNTRHFSEPQECVLDVCIQVYSNNECNRIYSCYITIPLHQGQFELSSQSNEVGTCPPSMWAWKHTSSGGALSIRIRQEDRGVISVDCTGIIVHGHNEVINSHTATFHLIRSLHDQLLPSCNVHICVRQDQFFGCKKSFDCTLTIPNENTPPRTARNLPPQAYEEPSEDLLKSCEQENLESDSVVLPCSDKTWDVFYSIGYAIGEVSLQINLQGNDKIDEFVKVSLYCFGLYLKGSTEYRLVIPKTLKETVVEFNISLPKSSNEEPQTYQCTLRTQRRPVPNNEQANDTMCPSTTSCSISVKTVLGRILPKCNVTEGRESVHQIDVVHKQAKLEITVSASPNNVYTVDPYCNKNNPFGHNTSEELLSNIFPSTTTGEGHVTIAISFQPECDNKTIASHFVNKRLEDCHMDLYWHCQGGEKVIESVKNLHFSDESMYCEPQSIVKTLIQSVQKSFGVYNEPVAISLAILIGVASLYGLLIPASFVAIYCHCRGNNSYHKLEEDDEQDDENMLCHAETKLN